MTFTSTAPRLLLAAVCAGALLSAPVLTAPPAHAACAPNQMVDPVTGVCWTGSQMGSGISGTGGTCLPGRLGLCLGALANSQMPGANLPTNTGVTSGRQTWP